MSICLFDKQSTSSIHTRAENTNCSVSLSNTCVYDILAQTSPTDTLGPNVPGGYGPGSGPGPKSGASVDLLVEDGVPGVSKTKISKTKIIIYSMAIQNFLLY